MKLESVKSIFAKAIMSGIMIGIGGTVYLMVDNKYLGGFLFSFGCFLLSSADFHFIPEKSDISPKTNPFT